MKLKLLFAYSILINICFSVEISKTDSLAIEARNNLKLADRYWYDDKDKAFEFYFKTIDLAKKSNSPEIAEKAYEGLGSLYFENRKFKKSIAQYNLAIKTGKSHKSNKIHKWQEYIAECLYNFRKFNVALDTLTIAEKLSKEQGDIYVLVRIYDLRARIYYILNLYSLSEIALLKAIKYEKSTLSKKFIGRFYERLADLLMKKKKYMEAIKYYNLSLNNLYSKHNENFKNELKCYLNERIGDAHFSKENYHLAEKYYLNSLKIAKSINHKTPTWTALYALMELSYKQNNYISFFNYYSQIESLNISNNFNRDVYLLKGNVFFELNKLDSATANYKKALTIIEGNQNRIQVADLRMSTLSTKEEYFNRLARVYKKKLMEENSNFSINDSLFKYLNAGRSRSLFEKKVANTNQVTSAYGASIKELQKFQREVRYGDFANEIERDIKLNSLKYDLVASRIENLEEQIIGHKNISLPEFQSYLKKTEATSIIYSLTHYEQYALVIDKNSFKIVELNIDMDRFRGKQETLLNNAFFNKNFKDNSFNAKIAHELYQELWQPLEENSSLANNIIIIPDTPIHSLPFDILLTGEDSLDTYSFYDAPYYVEKLLINTYNIAVLPSANLIKSLKPLKNEKALIFANSVFSTKTSQSNVSWAFRPLVFSKREAVKIQDITQGRILEKELSSESEFKKQAAHTNIIHLATHAFVDTVFDLFSGLAFSINENTQDDGLLMGYEIEQLDLNCDLVTLSACESGKGRVLSGEGVLGLPRQFFNAGARSTLMSLWKVDDRLSSELMPLFYNNLLQKRQLKIEALGNAKRSIIKNYTSAVNGVYYANPFFWASFTLYGDIENNSAAENNQKDLVYFVLIILFIFTAITFARKKYFL